MAPEVAVRRAAAARPRLLREPAWARGALSWALPPRSTCARAAEYGARVVTSKHVDSVQQMEKRVGFFPGTAQVLGQVYV